MAQAVDIFAYLDYQAYLRDWFESRKGSGKAVSLQAYALKLGLKSRGHFYRVMHDPSKPMSDGLRVRLSELAGHGPREAEYFEILVGFGRAKSPEESRHFYRQIHRLQGNRRTPIRTIDQFEFFRSWYLPVLRELATTTDWNGDYELLAGLVAPPIGKLQAKKGIELLVRLGLLVRRPDGVLAQADPVLHSGHDLESQAILEYQEAVTDLAKDALRRVPREMREINTVTFGMSKAMLPQVQALARKFQEDLIHLVVDCPEPVDSVYHLNVQCFPLSKWEQEKT